MTEEKAKKIIIDHVDSITKKSSWWPLSRRRFNLEFSKFMEPYEKEANLPPREELSFPHFTMNKAGLNFGDIFYKWNEVFGIAIKTESIYNANADMNHYIKNLIFCSKDGNIQEFTLGDTSYLKNLLKHFIAVYKEQFDKDQKTNFQ